MRPADFGRLLKLLSDGEVEFIVVGGVAAAVHGAARATYDLDVCYGRDRPNLDRIVAVLAGLHPYLRGAPAGLPFQLNAPTLRAGLNFTLQTDAGDLDLLGEIVGGGRFEDLRAHATEVELFGTTCLCVTLPKLIAMKRAAGRPKDHDALAELEVLLEERGNTDP
jgi:predicted nucleotidyltransferase